MAYLDWFYSRPGCKSCSRAERFLKENGVVVRVRLDARKAKLKRLESFRLAKQVTEVYATFKRFLLFMNLKGSRRDADALARMILGRTGRLRPPALKCGTTLIVGYDEELYRRVLGLRKQRLAS